MALGALIVRCRDLSGIMNTSIFLRSEVKQMLKRKEFSTGEKVYTGSDTFSYNKDGVYNVPDTVDYAILTCTACHSGMNTYRLLNGVRVVRGAEIRAALDGKTRCAVFFNQSGGLVTVGYNSNYKTRTATYRVDGYHYY